MPNELIPPIRQETRKVSGRPIRDIYGNTVRVGAREGADGCGPPLTNDQIRNTADFATGLSALNDPQKLLPYFLDALAQNRQLLQNNPGRFNDPQALEAASWKNVANAIARSHSQIEKTPEAVLREIFLGINLVAGFLTENPHVLARRPQETYISYPQGPQFDKLRQAGLEAVVICPVEGIAERWLEVARQVIAESRTLEKVA